MGSDSTDLLPLELPVIDLSKEAALTPGTPEWDLAKFKVRDALKEFGCFKALYIRVQSELRSSFFGAVEELFNPPGEIKQRNVSKTIFHGYRVSNPMAPLPESLGFDDPEIRGIHPEYCWMLKTEASTDYALSPKVLCETISHDIAMGLIPLFLGATVIETLDGAAAVWFQRVYRSNRTT